MLTSDWKKFKSKVKISFTNGKIFEASGIDKVLQVDLKEELANNNTNPLGVVSANTISLKILDFDKLFVKNNKLSPYYGYIREGFKIEYFIALDDGEYTNMGVFYATDIKNNASNGYYNTVDISGADIIQYISNTPVNIMGIQRNITIKQYIEIILQSVGLDGTKYNISNSLNKVLKYSFIIGDKLKDVLNSIAQSYMCNIYVDRDGIIQVVDLLELVKNNVETFVFDGITNTFQTSLGTDLLDTYNAIRVNYSNPTMVKNDNLLDLKDIEIESGTSELSEFTFGDNKRSLGISYVDIVCEDKDTTIGIHGIHANQNSIILSVNNSSEEKVKANIRVVGNAINNNEAVIERFIQGVEKDKRKFIDIDAPLIQTDSYAINYCTTILNYLSNDTSYIKLRTKGNPLLKLGDIVGVKSSLLEFDGSCIISSIRLSMGSSYTCNIDVLNRQALLPS